MIIVESSKQHQLNSEYKKNYLKNKGTYPSVLENGGSAFVKCQELKLTITFYDHRCLQKNTRKLNKREDDYKAVRKIAVET